MRVGEPSIETVSPSTRGLPPYRDCHNPNERSATFGAFGLSSACVKLRPINGCTPSAGRNVDSTCAHVKVIGRSSVRSQSGVPVQEVKMLNGVVLRRRYR